MTHVLNDFRHGSCSEIELSGRAINRAEMPATNLGQVLLALLSLTVTLAASLPYTLVLAPPSIPSSAHLTSKRAFDRLDMSSFDFGAYRKRAFDRLAESDFGFMTRKRRAFDRLDGSVFGLMKKRSFDRLDSGNFGFGMGKRSADYVLPAHLLSKRPFDRLERSAFGLSKRSAVPIALGPEVVDLLDLRPVDF
uniref:Orcokinin n=1 Tax=Steinernema glaseri TaxID=37863 RepID=A0A1I8AIK5_9BILA